jgi:hypothetical protein
METKSWPGVLRYAHPTDGLKNAGKALGQAAADLIHKSQIPGQVVADRLFGLAVIALTGDRVSREAALSIMGTYAGHLEKAGLLDLLNEQSVNCIDEVGAVPLSEAIDLIPDKNEVKQQILKILRLTDNRESLGALHVAPRDFNLILPESLATLQEVRKGNYHILFDNPQVPKELAINRLEMTLSGDPTNVALAEFIAHKLLEPLLEKLPEKLEPRILQAVERAVVLEDGWSGLSAGILRLVAKQTQNDDIRDFITETLREKAADPWVVKVQAGDTKRSRHTFSLINAKLAQTITDHYDPKDLFRLAIIALCGQEFTDRQLAISIMKRYAKQLKASGRDLPQIHIVWSDMYGDDAITTRFKEAGISGIRLKEALNLLPGSQRIKNQIFRIFELTD